MKYEFRQLDKKTVSGLIALSKKWEKEDCSYGMTVNTEDDIKTPLCVALEQDEIIGYIFGHYYIAEHKTSYIDIGRKCFSIDELYVLPEYRNQGIGKELFKRMEQETEASCAYITLSTSTKDYRKILHFYAEEMNMNFHSAFLIKATKGSIR